MLTPPFHLSGRRTRCPETERLSGELHPVAHNVLLDSEACRVYFQALNRILNAALYGAFVVQSDFFTVKLRARDSIIQSCLGAAIKLVPVPGADVAATVASSTYYAYGAKALVCRLLNPRD